MRRGEARLLTCPPEQSPFRVRVGVGVRLLTCQSEQYPIVAHSSEQPRSDSTSYISRKEAKVSRKMMKFAQSIKFHMSWK